MTAYALTALYRNEGTVVIFEGWRVPAAGEPHDSGRYLIAVDHRPARDLLEVIEAGEEPVVQPEPWQVIGRLSP